MDPNNNNNTWKHGALLKALKRGDVLDPAKFILNQVRLHRQEQFLIQDNLFWREQLPAYIHILLTRRDVHQNLAIEFLSNIGSQCLSLLNRNMSGPYQCLQFIYGMPEDAPVYSQDFDDNIEYDEMSPSWSTSLMFVELAKKFLHDNGFEICCNRIRNFENKIPTPYLRILLDVLNKVMISMVENDIDIGVLEKINEIYSIMVQLLESWSDEEIKNLDKRELSATLDILEEIVSINDAEEVTMNEKVYGIAELKLVIAKRCLLSNSLEKRLSGLTDIREMISFPPPHLRDKFPRKLVLPPEYMKQWLLDFDIIGYLFGPSMHVELLSRCAQIICFLIEERAITKEHIDTMWKPCVGSYHKSIVQGIFSLFSELCKYFPVEFLDHLYSCLKTFPQSQYDNATLHMLHQFTQAAIINNQEESKRDNVPLGDIPLYATDLLWKIIQDDTTVAPDIATQAFQMLAAYITWTPIQPHRIKFLESCIQNIIQHQSVPISLQLLPKLIAAIHTGGSMKHPKPVTVSNEAIEKIVLQLEEKYKLLDIFLKDTIYYKSNCSQSVSNISAGVNIYSMVLYGRHTHSEQVNCRLDFFTLLLDSVREFDERTFTIVDNVWNCFVLDAICAEEQNAAFIWFTDTTKVRMLDYLYNNWFHRYDISSMTNHGFQFWRFCFIHINVKDLILMPDNTVAVQKLDLVGIEYWWKLVLLARMDGVAMNASDFLISLYLNYTPGPDSKAINQRELFIEKCMTELTAPENGLNKINRILDLLEKFQLKHASQFPGEIESAGIIPHRLLSRGQMITLTIHQLSSVNTLAPLTCYTNDTVLSLTRSIAKNIKNNADPNSIRFIFSGKDLTQFVHKRICEVGLKDGMRISIVDRPKPLTSPAINLAENDGSSKVDMEIEKDLSTIPAVILSKKYFSTLFQMLTSEPFVADKIWKLLMTLPTNEEVFQRLKSLPLHSSQPNWVELLDPSNVFKLLYNLQIVEYLVDTSTSVEWNESFVRTGGVQHLINIFLQNDFLNSSENGPLHKTCLSSLLKLINLALVSFENIGNLATFMKKLIATTYTIVDPNLGNLEAEIVLSANSDVLQNSLLLLFRICLWTPSSDNVELPAKIFCEIPDMSEWLSQLLLRCNSKSLRQVSRKSLLSFAGNAFASLPNNVSCAHRLLESLVSLLPATKDFQYTCEEYFETLVSVLNLYYKSDNTLQRQQSLILKLLNDSISAISALPNREVFGGMEDQVLLGLLNVTKTIFKILPIVVPMISDFDGMFNLIFMDCLFYVGTGEETPNSPPKCKTTKSRESAFEVALEIVKRSPSAFMTLCEKLKEFNSGEGVKTWNFSPQNAEKAPSGFVGLKNLGATCYMNSILQQFYMISQFRDAILSVTDKDPNPQESLLYQLQVLFSNLQESTKKFYDTSPFCHAYKDYEGNPMNTSIQMDVDEFFNMLFDRLENILKETPAAEILFKKLFSGKLMQQIKSLDCPHISEREESFFALQCDVKNKKNILESLHSYVKGELLEGDNKYFCATCQTKVTAIKRACVKKLPRTLILHLKRFEFDMELLKRLKINDYYEFPMEFDMSPFTLEYITQKEQAEELKKKEEKKATAEGGDEKKKVGDSSHPRHPSASVPPSASSSPVPSVRNAQYQLVGILIHTGTAESGHYFSYIQDRSKTDDGMNGPKRWYQFNDTLVEPFDPENVPDQCFGGYDSATHWDSTLQREVRRPMIKPYSAYMLFYEQVDPEPEEVAAADNSDSETTSMDVIAPTKTNPLLSNIHQYIWKANRDFLRDKFIFEDLYFHFMWEAMTFMLPRETVDMTLHPYNKTSCNMTGIVQSPLKRSLDGEAAASVGKDNRKLLEAAAIASTYYFINTLSHARDRGDIGRWVRLLCKIYDEIPDLNRWLLATLTKKQDWLTLLLLQCNVREVQHAFIDLVSHAFLRCRMYCERPISKETLRLVNHTYGDEYVSASFVSVLLGMVDDAHPYWRNFEGLFKLMCSVASIGQRERHMLLVDVAIERLVAFFLAEDCPSELLPGNADKNLQRRRRKRTMGDKHGYPSLSVVAEVIATLVCCCDLSDFYTTATATAKPTISDHDTLPSVIATDEKGVPIIATMEHSDTLPMETEGGVVEITVGGDAESNTQDTPVTVKTVSSTENVAQPTATTAVAAAAGEATTEAMVDTAPKKNKENQEGGATTEDEAKVSGDVTAATASDGTAPTKYPPTLLVDFAKDEIPLLLTKSDLDALFVQDGSGNHLELLFLPRLLRDGGNTNAILRLFQHLCWENWRFSEDILKLILSTIESADSDSASLLGILTGVLSLKDSFAKERLQFVSNYLIRFISSNGMRSTYPGHDYILYLDMLIDREDAVTVRAFLIEAIEDWLINCLLHNIHPMTHQVTVKLVKALMKDSESDIDYALLNKTFKLLLRHLSTAHKNILIIKDKDSINGYLVGYLQLLNFCIRSKLHKIEFGHNLQTFFEIFTIIDHLHITVDENKRELTYLWLNVLKDCPENVEMIVKNERMSRTLIEYYILLDKSVKTTEYNCDTLPKFYMVLHICCKASKTFRALLASHPNFNWAIQHMVLNGDYPEVAAELFELITICVPESATGREILLNSFVFYQHVDLNYIPRFLDCLLLTDTDWLLLIEKEGLIKIAMLLYTYSKEDGSGALLPVYLELLAIFKKGLAILNSLLAEEQSDFKTSFDGNSYREILVDFVKQCFAYMNTFTSTELRIASIDICNVLFGMGCFDFLALLFLDTLLDNHEDWVSRTRQNSVSESDLKETYFGNYSPFLPYANTFAPKELIPHIAQFSAPQMHAHPLLLHLLPSQIEREKVFAEFYQPYYDFVVNLCDTSFPTNDPNMQIKSLQLVTFLSLETIYVEYSKPVELLAKFLQQEKLYLLDKISDATTFVLAMLTRYSPKLVNNSVRAALREIYPKVKPYLQEADLCNLFLERFEQLRQSLTTLHSISTTTPPTPQELVDQLQIILPSIAIFTIMLSDPVGVITDTDVQNLETDALESLLNLKKKNTLEVQASSLYPPVITFPIIVSELETAVTKLLSK